MMETAEDIQRLQATLDSSIEKAGDLLRHSFQMPDHSLSALQLASYLQGVRHVALATVTSRGEPRVAPVAALFYRGRFYIPTTTTSLRARHIRRRPAVSLTHFTENGFALIAHGRASIIIPDQDVFAIIERIQRELQHSSPRDWGDGAYLLIEADVLYTYARHPRRFHITPTVTPKA